MVTPASQVPRGDLTLERRETRVRVHAGAGEHHFTIELRLLCDLNAKHVVGTVVASAGGSWKPRIHVTSTGTKVSRARARSTNGNAPTWPTCERCGEPAGGTIFDTIDSAEDVCPAHDPGPEPSASAADAGTRSADRVAPDGRRLSVVRLRDNPKTGQRAARLSWECCHCAQDWRRLNSRGTRPREDKVLRSERIGEVLRLMHADGPSRLAVQLDPRALEETAAALRQRAAKAPTEA